MQTKRGPVATRHSYSGQVLKGCLRPEGGIRRQRLDIDLYDRPSEFLAPPRQPLTLGKFVRGKSFRLQIDFISGHTTTAFQIPDRPAGRSSCNFLRIDRAATTIAFPSKAITIPMVGPIAMLPA